jgi:hypothetical protein
MCMTTTSFIMISALFTLMLPLLPMGCSTVGNSDSDSEAHSDSAGDTSPGSMTTIPSRFRIPITTRPLIRARTPAWIPGLQPIPNRPPTEKMNASITVIHIPSACHFRPVTAATPAHASPGRMACGEPCNNLSETQCESAATWRPVTGYRSRNVLLPAPRAGSRTTVWRINSAKAPQSVPANVPAWLRTPWAPVFRRQWRNATLTWLPITVRKDITATIWERWGTSVCTMRKDCSAGVM